MTISNLTKTTIINGASSLAVAQQEGIIYRLQPVEEVVPIAFEDLSNLQIKEFYLSEILTKDYKIVGIDHDVATDDTNDPSQTDSNSTKIVTDITIGIRRNNVLIRNIYLQIRDMPTFLSSFYLHHNDTWTIKSSAELKRLTLYGIPVIINPVKTIPAKSW